MTISIEKMVMVNAQDGMGERVEQAVMERVETAEVGDFQRL